MDVKEFKVIVEIGCNHTPSQRLIAKRVGISLGLTNIIIKRLIGKGYVRIFQVPPNRFKYMLTPKGFAEKARKSYAFALRTIELLRIVKTNIQEVILKMYHHGYRDFRVSGTGEILALTEMVFRELELKDIKFGVSKDDIFKIAPSCFIITKKGDQEIRVNLLSELAQKGVFYSS